MAGVAKPLPGAPERPDRLPAPLGTAVREGDAPLEAAKSAATGLPAGQRLAGGQRETPGHADVDPDRAGWRGVAAPLSDPPYPARLGDLVASEYARRLSDPAHSVEVRPGAA